MSSTPPEPFTAHGGRRAGRGGPPGTGGSSLHWGGGNEKVLVYCGFRLTSEATEGTKKTLLVRGTKLRSNGTKLRATRFFFNQAWLRFR